MTNFDIAQKEIQTLNSLLNYNAEEMWDEITELLSIYISHIIRAGAILQIHFKGIIIFK